MPRWTPESRLKHIELMRLVRPWSRSTGPRTPEGKAVSSRNAWKGGGREMVRAASRKVRALCASTETLIRAARDLIVGPRTPRKVEPLWPETDSMLQSLARMLGVSMPETG